MKDLFSLFIKLELFGCIVEYICLSMSSSRSSFFMFLPLETLLWPVFFFADNGGCLRLIFGGLPPRDKIAELLFLLSYLLKMLLRSLATAGFSFLDKFLKTSILTFSSILSNSLSERCRIYLFLSVSPLVMPFGYSRVSAFVRYSSFSKIKLRISTRESLSPSR